jgi:hypothetical protein
VALRAGVAFDRRALLDGVFLTEPLVLFYPVEPGDAQVAILHPFAWA